MDDPLSAALRLQSSVCAHLGSPFNAALLQAAAADPAPPLRALFAPWEGRPREALMADAVALRFVGALHDLVLDAAAPDLARFFPPHADAARAWPAALAAIEDHGARIQAFMGHEPQTNEVGRAACLLPGFLTVGRRTRLPLRCLELGASAGLNQLWPQLRYRYGAWGTWGDPASPVCLEAEWRGSPPPLGVAVTVVETAACDRAPVRLSDPAARRRLAAYVWPDQAERLERLQRAVRMALAAGVAVEAGDAVDWVRSTAAPRPGLATVIYHSVFWQYLAAGAQQALAEAIADHGAAASDDAPLAWLRMEPGAGASPFELRLSVWPGGLDCRLATVHAHGAWIDWGGLAD